MKKIILAAVLASFVAAPAIAAEEMKKETTTVTKTETAAPVEVKLKDGTVVYTTEKEGKTTVWKSDKKTSVGAGTWTTADGKTITTDAEGAVVVK